MTIEVLVADDSPIFAETVREALEADPTIRVVGVAANGKAAVQMTAALEPDVITMDVHMPELDGFEAVELIMQTFPTPILVLTSDPRGHTGQLAMEALAKGALDLQEKPTDLSPNGRASRDLREHVKLLASVPVVHRRSPKERPRAARLGSQSTRANRIVLIGASTGGPSALASILGQLPPDFPLPIVIVQHLAEGFAPALASWLSAVTTFDVKVAETGAELAPRRVFIAPSGKHLVFDRSRSLRLEDGRRGEDHVPAVDRLFRSAAEVFGASAVGLVLTGMGRDGAAGLDAIKRHGGLTLAQDQLSSTVYGMPKAARESGAARVVASLAAIPRVLCRAATGALVEDLVREEGGS